MIAPAADVPLLLSIADTAAHLSISVRLVKSLIQRGELRSVKVGARRLVHTKDLEDFAERLRAEAGR